MTTLEPVATSRTETPVYFSAGKDTLFGILTRPAVEPNGKGVILLPGSGPSALYRNQTGSGLTKELAARGFYCLRFDYHGVRESSGTIDGYDLTHPFAEDVLAAVTCLRDHGVERFVLIGSCFGSRAALSSAPKIEGLELLVLMDTAVRDFRAGEAAMSARAEAWAPRDYVRRGLRPQVILGLLDGTTRRRYLHLLQALWRRVRNRIRGTIVGGPSYGVASPRFLNPLKRLADKGVKTVFVYGAEDGSYRDFRAAEKGALGELIRQAGASVTVHVTEGSSKLHLVEDRARTFDLILSELGRDAAQAATV